MKKILIGLFSVLVICILVPGGIQFASAQQNAGDEFMLEEITVTAEKREGNVQQIPASVQALAGLDLVEQGKMTTAQILESVPNVTYRSGWGTNPNGNIAIRGIQRTQTSGGTNDILPSTTAVYVDGVYQGIGGNYDINRVEVLRGPQGTLYGRSATAGVVAFHTNNPELSEFGGTVSGEYGTASLMNVQAAVNIPVGDKLAFRAAGHYFDRDGYYEEEGGQITIKEGRAKILYQPVDALEIVASISAQETVEWGGGWTPYLTGPNEINWEGKYTVPAAGAPSKYNQAAITVNYDFGDSTLTYIGGYHDFDSTGLGAEEVKGGAGHANWTDWPTDYYHSEEIRWASDTDDTITWLVGANYHKHEFDTFLASVQTSWPEDPEIVYERDYLAPLWDRKTDGTFENYGIFTEETFELSDDFRITAGLRYDRTELIQSQIYNSNDSKTALGNVMNTGEFVTGILNNDKHDYNNITYKLRFEKDLTPDSMVYFLTSTGFMPGYTAISPNTQESPITFQFLVLDEQKLTSYELGSKNQFLNDTLRLNGAVFYYDYEGYPEAVNLRWGAGPPVFTVVAVPLEIFGVEMEAEYLLTMYDKFSFSAGYLKTKITDFPDTVTWLTMANVASETSGRDAMLLDEVPGHPDLKVNLAYDHTFVFGNGSTLVPRAELVYNSAHYVSQVNIQMADLGQMPYAYQDAYTIANAGATWTSPDYKYSVSAYGRNLTDEEYKTGVQLNKTSNDSIGVTVGDPRTFGVMVNLKF